MGLWGLGRKWGDDGFVSGLYRRYGLGSPMRKDALRISDECREAKGSFVNVGEALREQWRDCGTS